MGKAWLIAWEEYRINLRRPGFIIMTALVPVLGAIGLLIAAAFSGQALEFVARTFVAGQERIGVVDHSGLFTPLLPEYRDRYRVFDTEQDARAALEAGEVTTVLVIPDDYVASGQVLVLSEGNAMRTAMLEDSGDLRTFFVDHLLRDRLDPTLRARVSEPYELVAATPGAEGGGLSGALGFTFTVMVPFVLSTFLITTIFVSSGYLLRSVAEEKTNRVIEILISSVTAQELLAGKVIGLGALGLTQVAVWAASVAALSGGALVLLGVLVPLLTRPEVLILGLLYYVLGFLVYAVLMGAMGALGTNMQESQQLAGIFSFMAAIPFMLSGFLFTNPDMLLARVFSWFPLTAPTMMMLRLALGQVPWLDVAISLVGLTLTIPAVLWAGAKVFRTGLLMYGKRPSVRQVLRALREA